MVVEDTFCVVLAGYGTQITLDVGRWATRNREIRGCAVFFFLFIPIFLKVSWFRRRERWTNIMIQGCILPLIWLWLSPQKDLYSLIISVYHSWPRRCHLNSPSRRHRGNLQASSDSCCHSGERSHPYASYTAVHQNGPDTEVHHRKSGPFGYTSFHGHTEIDLFGFKQKKSFAFVVALKSLVCVIGFFCIPFVILTVA